ncbi:multiprotein-bridging factor 1 family protein [Streptomyces sp. NPDC090022]|uniref:helix-turn-helix domain-containing protein n=1 Tax=Streptomyces sp. NPDC090022 TaxID=3365920 RepID=UPI0038285B10
MTGNAVLRARMADLGLTQEELAARMNVALLEITGRPGDVSARTVRNLLSGATLRPIGRTRVALERVFGCPSTDLGFAPTAATASSEDPVLRRSFCTATVGALAASVPGVTSGRSAGMSDVFRLRDGMAALTALDQTRGGHIALERAALGGAAEAVRLQRNAVSQTVRQRLLSVAAHYTSAAAWSCIDARRLDRARVHLNEALSMAGMAQDPAAQLLVWNATAMLAHQRRDYGEGIAAAQAAQTTTAARRDPLFSSLTHARTAIGHAGRGDHRPALRSLGHAEAALAKADLTAPRPPWIGFYGPAELAALTAAVHRLLGRYANAEAASHRALATLPTELRRNRSMAVIGLAFAQLHQGDVDLACATTGEAFELMAGDRLPGRLRTRVGDFHRALFMLAPSARPAREWSDRYRTEWSTA